MLYLNAHQKLGQGDSITLSCEDHDYVGEVWNAGEGTFTQEDMEYIAYAPYLGFPLTYDDNVSQVSIEYIIVKSNEKSISFSQLPLSLTLTLINDIPCDYPLVLTCISGGSPEDDTMYFFS